MLQKGRINIELNHAIGYLKSARFYFQDSTENLELNLDRQAKINRLIEEIKKLKFDL